MWQDLLRILFSKTWNMKHVNTNDHRHQINPLSFSWTFWSSCHVWVIYYSLNRIKRNINQSVSIHLSICLRRRPLRSFLFLMIYCFLTPFLESYSYFISSVILLLWIVTLLLVFISIMIYLLLTTTY